MPDDQFAARPVTDVMLAAWRLQAEAEQTHLRPGSLNWIVMFRSLDAEITRLRAELAEVRAALRDAIEDSDSTLVTWFDKHRAAYDAAVKAGGEG
ncbi:MAG: hypothetical protein KGL39_30305 [Patescibacteria group bacterium]|nr:hypothetical protein [Patescibacteria group bacterium]